MRVYCDGIFDLFHRGHLEHLAEVRGMFPEMHTLIVGVISDLAASTYKRQPMMNQKQRLMILTSCVYVDEAFVTDQLVMTQDFLQLHSIDLVVHAFSSEEDKIKQAALFQPLVDSGRFVELNYHHGLSTTQIITEHNLTWSEIWEKEGGSDGDLLNLSGCDYTSCDPGSFVNGMKQRLKMDIEPHSRILEIGCGAGLLGSFFSNCNYIGTESSRALAVQHLRRLKKCTLNFKPTETIFKTDFFEFSFLINGDLEYLETLEDVLETVQEMRRVTRNGIYVGNLRLRGESAVPVQDIHDVKHHQKRLLIPPKFFEALGLTVEPSLSDPENKYDAWERGRNR